CAYSVRILRAEKCSTIIVSRGADGGTLAAARYGRRRFSLTQRRCARRVLSFLATSPRGGTFRDLSGRPSGNGENGGEVAWRGQLRTVTEHRPRGVAGSGALVAQLRGENVAAQRLLDEEHGLRGRGEAAALGPVGGEHGVDRVRGQYLAELGPGRTVPGPGALHAGLRMVPGHRGQGRR